MFLSFKERDTIPSKGENKERQGIMENSFRNSKKAHSIATARWFIEKLDHLPWKFREGHLL